MNVTNELWRDLESKTTKEAKKVLKALDYDIVSVYEDKNVYYLEPTASWVVIPKYVKNYIKKWQVKRGHIYLYDIPTKGNDNLT